MTPEESNPADSQPQDAVETPNTAGQHQDAVEQAETAVDEVHEAAGVNIDAVFDDTIRAAAPRQTSGVVFSAKQVRRARDLLARLYALRRTKRFYPEEHPAVEQAASDLLAILVQYHDEGVDVPLAFYEDELLLGEQLLAEDSVLFDQLIRDMTAIGAGSIVFSRGVTADELKRLAVIIASNPEETAAAGGIPAMMDAADVRHVTIREVTVFSQHAANAGDADAQKAAKASYTEALDLMRELERLLHSSQVVNVSHVKGTVRSLIENVLNNRYAMLELSGLKNYDEYTFYHSVNVAILSLALGSALTTDFRFLSTLGVGALLHDLGKLTVDLATLNKTGPLSTEEWAEIRQHPILGAENAVLTPGLDKAAVVMILEHHMRLDLTGYPQRVQPRPQHLASRIVAVADAYDAMTSRRSYSAARRQDEAISILVKNAGTALDGTLVRLFVNLMGLYPPRSVVLLSSGETGVVIAPGSSDITAPRVRIVAAADGTMIDPVDVDLEDASQAAGRRIERCLDPVGLNVDVADFL